MTRAEAVRALRIREEALARYGGKKARCILVAPLNGGRHAFFFMTAAPERFASLLTPPASSRSSSAMNASPRCCAVKPVYNGVGAADPDWKLKSRLPATPGRSGLVLNLRRVPRVTSSTTNFDPSGFRFLARRSAGSGRLFWACADPRSISTARSRRIASSSGRNCRGRGS